MSAVLDLGDLAVEVVRKPIKHLHLGVYPPDGRVRVATPERLSLNSIRLFVIGKLPWIRQQQKRMLAQARAPALEYVERESHFLWGRRYLLRILTTDRAPAVVLRARTIDLHVRLGFGAKQRGELMERWYRDELRRGLQPLLEKWQRLLNVKAERVYLQRMKTKWGSCNPHLGNIRLNTELARKPLECLEYIVVHELVHLREPDHGPRFVALMDSALPGWRDLRDVLNRLPLNHADWTY